MVDFIDGLVSHYVLDGGKLVVAHAGMKEAMQGRSSKQVRDFALYGETTGETDEFGLPVRYNWAAEYRGRAMVVYGHTPVPEPEWLNGTINIDTGCVFGGRLTALRYPEKELVSVPAERTWCRPAKPFPAHDAQAPVLSAQQEHDDVLDLADVLGKRIVETRLYRTVTIRAENAGAALEVMSRFAANPKWLIYLPPTMSPSETVPNGALLEHPAQAFAYYRHEGITTVICEEKHMGSRAVIIVCRDAGVARRRFDIVEDEDGIVYTRTGRRFFEDPALERGVLDRIRRAVDDVGLWEELATDWLLLDCELMPWSAKAQELLITQYAAVGAAARVALDEAISMLERAAARGADSRQADGVRRPRPPRACAARHEVPWARVSADHLRSGVHASRAHRAAALAQPVSEAVACPQGVRFGNRGPGAVHQERAAPPRPRVRLRRPGAGKRAGGPAAMSHPAEARRFRTAAPFAGARPRFCPRKEEWQNHGPPR